MLLKWTKQTSLFTFNSIAQQKGTTNYEKANKTYPLYYVFCSFHCFHPSKEQPMYMLVIYLSFSIQIFCLIFFFHTHFILFSFLLYCIIDSFICSTHRQIHKPHSTSRKANINSISTICWINQQHIPYSTMVCIWGWQFVFRC